MNLTCLKPEYKEFLSTKLPESKKKFSIDLTKYYAKNIQEFFLKTNFQKDEWPYSQSELDYLVNKKVLYFVEEEGCYLLTYKGLTILEYNLELYEELDCYLNDLNFLYFEKNMKKKDEPLKPQDKPILFTVLGLYAFSSDYSLYIDESNKSEFAKSVDFAIELLKIHNLKEIDKLNKIWDSEVIGEDPILSIRRRLTEIPPRTNNIFKTTSGNSHGIFIDIMNIDGSIDENKVLFLLKKVFNNKIFDKNEKEELIDTLNKIERGRFSLIQSSSNVNRIKIKRELRDIILEKL